jgi:hypothetical protein
MECQYKKNKTKRQIAKVKKVITRNESYVAYYNKIIAEGTATEMTLQSKKENEEFLIRMRQCLVDLENELKEL